LIAPPENIRPKDSREIQRLLSAAEQANIDTQTLREILWLTTAHNQLLAFATAAGRLINILDAIPKEWAEAIHDTNIDTWREPLGWVIDNTTLLNHLIGEQFSKQSNTTGGNPLRTKGTGGGTTLFPMFAVLTEPLPRGISGERFLLLSGHLLIAYVLAIRENSVLSSYEDQGPELKWHFGKNTVNGAGLAVRRLAEEKYWSALDELPLELPPDEFADTLESVAPPNHNELKNDRVNLFRYLQKSWAIIPWVDRAGGGGGGAGGGSHWVGGRLENFRVSIERTRDSSDTDENFAWGYVDIVNFKTGSTRKRNARIKSDLPPDEDDDEEQIILSDFECAITQGSPGAIARAARAKARHVLKANQKLPWAYDGLADEEIIRLVQSSRQELESLLALSSWTQEQHQAAEAHAALQITLWVGSDFDRVTQVRILKEHDAQLIDIDFGLIISAPPSSSQISWLIQGLSPEYKTDLVGTTEQVRPATTHFELPDICRLSPIIKRLQHENKRHHNNIPLFQTRKAVLEKRVKKWLNQQFTDGRVSLTKIENFLWSKIHQRTGDPVIASCVTGLNDTLARVRLFYTSPWVTDLQKHYLAALQPLIAEIYESPAPTSNPLPSKMASIGARLCPTVPAVRTYFKKLRQAIKESKGYCTRREFARHHNLLTLYAVQFFAYSTTCRAITTPYLPLAEIDSRRGIANLSDKDDEFKHKTRLIWVSPSLRENMARYETHLQALKAQLFELPRSLAVEPCFFIDEHFKATLVRPKTIEPILSEFLKVSANTHRRFLRTELIERDCPPEIVDAFLGHWQAGEEPFGTFSSLSFEDYVAELRIYLEPLLEEIGLPDVITGRLAR
jgi:hypothetical protein